MHIGNGLPRWLLHLIARLRKRICLPRAINPIGIQIPAPAQIIIRHNRNIVSPVVLWRKRIALIQSGKSMLCLTQRIANPTLQTPLSLAKQKLATIRSSRTRGEQIGQRGRIAQTNLRLKLHQIIHILVIKLQIHLPAFTRRQHKTKRIVNSFPRRQSLIHRQPHIRRISIGLNRNQIDKLVINAPTALKRDPVIQLKQTRHARRPSGIIATLEMTHAQPRRQLQTPPTHRMLEKTRLIKRRRINL